MALEDDLAALADMGVGVESEDDSKNVSESLQKFGQNSTGAFVRSFMPGHMPISDMAPSSAGSPMPIAFSSPVPLTPGGQMGEGVNMDLPPDGPLMPFVPNPPN